MQVHRIAVDVVHAAVQFPAIEGQDADRRFFGRGIVDRDRQFVHHRVGENVEGHRLIVGDGCRAGRPGQHASGTGDHHIVKDGVGRQAIVVAGDDHAGLHTGRHAAHVLLVDGHPGVAVKGYGGEEIVAVPRDADVIGEHGIRRQPVEVIRRILVGPEFYVLLAVRIADDRHPPGARSSGFVHGDARKTGAR